MNLCSDGHDEVCYEEKYCPACSLLSDVANLGSDLLDLRLELDAVKEELSKEVARNE